MPLGNAYDSCPTERNSIIYSSCSNFSNAQKYTGMALERPTAVCVAVNQLKKIFDKK